MQKILLGVIHYFYTVKQLFTDYTNGMFPVLNVDYKLKSRAIGYSISCISDDLENELSLIPAKSFMRYETNE